MPPATRSAKTVLVGTISIQNSEHLSSLLRKKEINHVVLNAKYHESEAKIIAQAGRIGAVTLATNMAGRGVDILLGGHPEHLTREDFLKKGIDLEENHQEEYEQALAETKTTTDLEHNQVIDLGGLHIIGTERHEARRIDNQLRGRAGRQGDPGSSRFYLSLEDDLMRIFGSDRISGLMARIGMGEGTPIEHNMVTKAIERAQRQVEGQNFTIRKHLLEYDDVMNKQRESIYGQRREILKGKNLKDDISGLIATIVDWQMETETPKEQTPDDWEIDAFQKAIGAQFGVDMSEWGIDWDTINFDELREKTLQTLTQIYEDKESQLGTEKMREFERVIMLQIIDTQWKDHLLGMDYLKEGIGLRGYGQRDPLIEYKKESYDMFQAMLDRIEDEALRYLFLIQPVVEEEMPERKEQPMYYQRAQGGGQVQTSRKARSVIPKKRKKKKKKR
jgi:preprotein translocase subunit SecA